MTGIAVLFGLIGLFRGGSKPEAKLAQVAFAGSDRGQTDAKAPAAKATVTTEATNIRRMLNDWYQKAYVDTSAFKDGSFPEVSAHLDSGAQATFAKDKNSMTIGDLRERAQRIVPSKQTANITVFFTAGNKPKFAVADVTFVARVTLKDEKALPVSVKQHGVYHLTNTGGEWMVSYYDVDQTEDSIQPTTKASS